MHLDKKKAQEGSISIVGFMDRKETPSSASASSTTQSSSVSESLTSYSTKVNYCEQQQYELCDPKIDLKHEPANQMEEFALGQAFKTINVDANKMISNAAVLEN